jgi:maleylacetate reductase
MAALETLFAPHDRLADWLEARGARKVLVLAPPSRRFVDRIVAGLARFSPAVFDGARVHVPAEVVDAAAARLAETGADALVAVGGGASIGLGKALRIGHDVAFAAVPTTYAGSEMTALYGVTRGADKQTGRDERVRPDVVLYDVELTRELPIALTAQSLYNAFAHVASACSTDSLAEPAEALAAARSVLHALEDLLLAPRARAPRERAQRGASACAAAIDRGTPGAQHALAHLLGGALGLEHAALHAVLLPQFLAHLRATSPDALTALERAVERPDLEAQLHDLLVRAGAPVSLAALGVTREALHDALAKRPDLPAAIALDALHGLRPPGRGGQIDGNT